jgi:hypothetical protein
MIHTVKLPRLMLKDTLPNYEEVVFKLTTPDSRGSTGVFPGPSIYVFVLLPWKFELLMSAPTTNTVAHLS